MTQTQVVFELALASLTLLGELAVKGREPTVEELTALANQTRTLHNATQAALDERRRRESGDRG